METRRSGLRVVNNKDQFYELCDRMKDCVKCSIGGYAHKHVFGRGLLPCQILFIGEGPGKTEDVIGQPFVGLAGKILDAAIDQCRPRATYFITNIVACRPTDEDGGQNRPPTLKEVTNCADRLNETIRLANPRVVVLLGRSAVAAWQSNNYNVGDRVKVYNMVHPAWLLRQGGVESEPFKQFVRQLKEAFRNA